MSELMRRKYGRPRITLTFQAEQKRRTTDRSPKARFLPGFENNQIMRSIRVQLDGRNPMTVR